MTNSNPQTDQDILENRTPGSNPDLDVEQRARDAGPAGTANQTDTTIDEDYTGGPKAVDPEQQLLDPDYEPDIPGGSDRQRATPGRPGFADNPGLGGMPNQSGELDQTTYHDRG